MSNFISSRKQGFKIEIQILQIYSKFSQTFQNFLKIFSYWKFKIEKLTSDKCNNLISHVGIWEWNYFSCCTNKYNTLKIMKIKTIHIVYWSFKKLAQKNLPFKLERIFSKITCILLFAAASGTLHQYLYSPFCRSTS